MYNLRIPNQARVRGVRLPFCVAGFGKMLLFEDHRHETSTVVHKSLVYAISFSPDGSQLATGARDGSVFVRDANA